MAHVHAVVRIDHQHAKVLQFGADDLKDEKIQARTDHTRTVDHPTEGQLLALARQYFLKHDRLIGTAPLA